MSVEYVLKCTNPLLSVCICTLSKRKQSFDLLCSHIKHFANGYLVEVLSLCDNGELSVGSKRNLLVDHSNGKYICAVDDDDNISTKYFQRICNATVFDPDVIGIEGVITFAGRNPKKFIHTMKCKEWHESQGVFYRSPNHLNPIRASLVRQVKFPEKNFGEDKDFSTRILPLLNTEVYIDTPIYFYQYDESKSATKGR